MSDYDFIFEEENVFLSYDWTVLADVELPGGIDNACTPSPPDETPIANVELPCGIDNAVCKPSSPDETPIPNANPVAVLEQSAASGGSIFAASAHVASAGSRRHVRLIVEAAQPEPSAAPPDFSVADLMAEWASQTRDVLALVQQLPADQKHDATHVFVAEAVNFYDTVIAPLQQELAAEPTAMEVDDGAANGLPELEPHAEAPQQAAELSEEQLPEPEPCEDQLPEPEPCEDRLPVPVPCDSEAPMPRVWPPPAALEKPPAGCGTPSAPPKRSRCDSPTTSPNGKRPVTPLTPRTLRPAISPDAILGAPPTGSARPVSASSKSAFEPHHSPSGGTVLSKSIALRPERQHWKPIQLSTAVRFNIPTPANLTTQPASLTSVAKMANPNARQITINLDDSESSALAWPVICEFVEEVNKRAPRLVVVLSCARLPRACARRLRGIKHLWLERLPGLFNYGTVTKFIDTSSVETLQVDGYINASPHMVEDSAQPDLSWRASQLSRRVAPAWDSTPLPEHPLHSLSIFEVKNTLFAGEDDEETYPAAMKTFIALDPLIRYRVKLIVPDSNDITFAQQVAEHVVSMPDTKCPPVQIGTASAADAILSAVHNELVKKKVDFSLWADRLSRVELPVAAGGKTFARLRVNLIDPDSTGAAIRQAVENIKS